MNIEQAKRIQLENLLGKLGFEPVEAKNDCLWYSSPFREEEVPSFVVDVYKNVWVDHGTDKGGNIIELAKELYQSDNLSDLLEKIEQLAPVIPQMKYSAISLITGLEEDVNCVSIEKMRDPKLISYFSTRKIDYTIAAEYCQQISFIRNAEDCQAVVFPNIHGGYELRSNLYSGHLLPLAISIVRMNPHVIASACCIFNDFIDFLSYKTLLVHGEDNILIDKFADIFILNSASMISKVLINLGSYTHIYCYLSNDQTGRTITETIQGAYEDRNVIDASDRYATYRTVSNYLQKKSWPKR